MKRITTLAYTITLMLIGFEGLSQRQSDLEFIENKGQWDKQVKFKGELSNGVFFLTATGYTIVQHNSTDLQRIADFAHGHLQVNERTDSSVDKQSSENITLRSHAFDVEFMNADKTVVIPDNPTNSYNNYFIGNDPSKWATNCKIFKAVTYSNIYPNTDVRYYTDNGSLKYDIIVKPGADINRIAMKYSGMDHLELRNEKLFVRTSVGEVKEMAPYTYQVVNGTRKEVPCKFKLQGNLVKFEVDNYLKSSTLIIDPELIFSTFTGSTADNWGNTATYGPDGSFYAGGTVFGSGFPISAGAFDTTYNGGASDEEGIGGYDIGIMKFSPDGTNRTYATYIGGSGNEMPFSLVVDAQGNLVIAGRSNSGNYPTTASNVGPGGNWDIIITKLNAAGSNLIGSLKIGGTGRDGVNIRPKYSAPRGVESIRRNYDDDMRSEIIIDNSGNILLASNTQSNDFPVTNVAFQKNYGGGRQDGVIIKTNSDLSNILFSSFIGGNNDDGAFALAVNPATNNIYIVGNTVSPNLPGDKTSVINPSFSGGICDGFLSIVSNDGSSLIKTSYLGTDGADMLYGIQFDNLNFPYVMGTSTGSWPIVNAAFSQPGGKQFIAKLKPDLSGYEYSTVYGTNSSAPNISPNAFFVDGCQNVYVTGWGGRNQYRSRFSLP